MFQKPSRKVDRIFVHCSASDNAAHDNVATMRDWHVNGNGWSDVGYHYFIRKSGQLENGRPVGTTPAAQGGNNTGTIAICLHGLAESKFTEAQFATLKALCVEINNAYSGNVTFHGHKEVAAKACPVFDYKHALKLDSFGRLGLSGAQEMALVTADSEVPSELPVLRRGDRGPAVQKLQKLLLLQDDGVFGPKTETNVKAFQAAKNLDRDGIVGAATWEALLNNDHIDHFD